MKAVIEMAEHRSVAEGEHLIASFAGSPTGPTLIAIGGIHGNEPAGAEALFEVAGQLEQIKDALRGRVYFLIGNTRALQQGIRFIDQDLNRSWTRECLSIVGSDRLMDISEGRELTELDRLLDSILITARAEVFVLDLHSTSAGGVPFATVGDTLRNRTFAQKFPVTMLLGIEEQLDGTMLEHLNNTGAVTLGFEGGRHDSPETVRNHSAIVWLALVNSGILDPKNVPDLVALRARLADGKRRGRAVEVRHREAISSGDGFTMLQGFNNFEPITAGQMLANTNKGPIRAAASGLILMPLYQKLGEDGFFIARAVAPFWLWLSTALRRLKLQNIVHWLPGVVRDPDDRETIIVNTQVARFFPLQIFHLLGFRKRRWSGGKLIVSRRRHDTVSPFEHAGR